MRNRIFIVRLLVNNNVSLIKRDEPLTTQVVRVLCTI